MHIHVTCTCRVLRVKYTYAAWVLACVCQNFLATVWPLPVIGIMQFIGGVLQAGEGEVERGGEGEVERGGEGEVERGGEGERRGYHGLEERARQALLKRFDYSLSLGPLHLPPPSHSRSSHLSLALFLFSNRHIHFGTITQWQR